MAFDEGALHEQLNSARARVSTLEEQNRRLQQKVRDVFETLCARERSGGSFTIDFKALVTKLGADGAAELRTTIDEVIGAGPAPAIADNLGSMFDLRGMVGKTITILAADPGQKPRVRLVESLAVPEKRRARG